MKNFKHVVAASGVVLASLVSFGAEASIPTQVQYSTAGDGIYDLTAINSFDNQNDSTLVIRDDNISTSTGATTVSEFFGGVLAGTTNIGDTISFDIHYQSVLTGFTTNNSSDAPVGFEITTVLSGTETAQVVAIIPNADPNLTQVIINFTAMQGTYQLFHDTDVNTYADLITGVGFDDGVNILSGNLGLASIGSTFTADFTGAGSGSTFLSNTITSYNSSYLEAFPGSNAPLVGTTVDTTINLDFGISSPINFGATIGDKGYVVNTADLRLSADAGIKFQAEPVPEPSSLFLLGGGLLMLGGLKKQRKA
ncbi:MAG: PEP-CTERM sorting domain-containing protein [Methyloprofundus sp.]|nr:PEP-CTERM sorting domain-containing protein [Methyloprofundus sp.]